MPKITTLECCGREQKAEFIEIAIPDEIRRFWPEIEHYYIAFVTADNCYNSKCHGSLKRFGLTYLKDIIVFPGKIKFLETVYRPQALCSLPFIKVENKKNTQDNRFYLMCNEYGRITRCYANLSTLKMGLVTDYYEQNKKLGVYN